MPCDFCTLWGINVRFQTVFLTERQVPHVLLTRPPLALNRSSPLVRLACVRRAASVRPEPGSNSLIMFIYSASLRTLNKSKSLFPSFKSCWLAITFGIYSNEYKGLILVSSCCSIFKVLLFSAVSCDSLIIISNHFLFVNTFFKKISNFFNIFLKHKKPHE